MRVRHRLALLLAAGSLLLSPGLAAAAAPNQLSGGSVTPGSGTTQTAFTFSVLYSSDRDFAATSVVAVVAGRSVTLSLVSGTSTSGTYRGSTSLPEGSWPVSFQAQATQGPDATLGGPTLVVRAAATPPPAPTTKPAPTPGPVVATPVPTPVPAAAPPAQTSGPAPSPKEAGQSPSAASDTSNSPRPSAPPSGPGASAAATPRVDSSQVVSSPSAVAFPGTIGGTSPADGAPPPWLPMVGLATVAGLLLVAWRRRASRGDPAVAVAADAVDPQPISMAERARKRQASAGPPSEDPILAAMGVGAPPPSEAQLGAPLTRSISTGPGERPTAARRRRVG